MLTDPDTRRRKGDGDTGGVDQETNEETARRNAQSALLSIVYLLLMLGFFSWQLFDTWIGQHSLPRAVGYNPMGLDAPAFRLIAYTVIGGGLGGIVNGIRSLLHYYHGFDRRHFWKYIAAPWMGATLGLLVFALIRSSVSLFGGGATTEEISTTQSLSNFAAGALAGYGSKDAFIWLDAQVHKLFRVPQEVPAVIGKTVEAAVSRLHAADLELGEVSEVPQENGKPAGTVIEQVPSPEETIARGDEVDITVAAGKT